MKNLNVFTGTLHICLWIRYRQNQSAGPPLKNAFVQFRVGTAVIARNYTNTTGCLSQPFEASFAESIIDILVDTPSGTFSSREYSPLIRPFEPSTQIDFQDHNVDVYSLPRKYFPQFYLCSTCKDAIDSILCQQQHYDIDFECCGYDFDTDQCRAVNPNPFKFSFGNICEECEEANEIEELEPGFRGSNPTPPIDCSTATHYYPYASMDTPDDERGWLSPLTNHTCTNPDHNTTVFTNLYRYGTSCCAYDYATKQCGLWEYNDGYQYMNEAKGEFLYPCSFGPSKNIGAIAGSIIGAFSCVFAMACFVFLSKRKPSHSLAKEQQSQDDEESNSPTDFNNDEQACNHEGNIATNYENIAPVPLPSAPPKEEYDIAIASPVICNNDGDNQVVYEAHIVSDGV